jgi:multidrug efflux system membrane fusion protein
VKLRELAPRARAGRFVIALAVLAAAGCKQDPPPVHAPRPVKAQTVATRSAASGLRYSASLHPQQEVQLAFKTSGYVSRIEQRRGADGRGRDLQQGDRVRRGTVLAALDDTDRVEQVNAARAQHAETTASCTKAELDMGRAERLYEAKSLTRPEYDAATAALAAARARVEAAAAQLHSAEIALADCRLVAPIDGVVLARAIEVGTLAAPGSVGFVLADVSRLEAVFGVPVREIAHLELGDSLPISIEGEPPFAAQITSLSPSADSESRAFRVEVAIPNRTGRYRTGMIATVVVPRAAAAPVVDAALSVPLGAVVRSKQDANAYAVFVIEGDGSEGVARQRTVRLGPIAGNNVTVESGLSPGERVVALGATLLQDGEAVRILP